MTFFVHGLSGHETMPMNRLFEKRAVNKTDAVFSYHGVSTNDKLVERKEEHTKKRSFASQSYYNIEEASPSDSAVFAADIMVSPVMVLTPASLISEALELFHKRQFRHVPVVSNEKGLVGMVSDRDVLRYLSEKAVNNEPHTTLSPIGNIMSSDIVSASTDTDVRYIARLFVEGRMGAMPIINNGKLMGIITRSDILRAVMKNFHIGLWA